MSYARHETFYIRDGWLRKGLKLIEQRGYDFFRDDEAPEILGVGKNMVNSIRFWLRATGLVVQEGSEHVQSDLAIEIDKYDPYFEDIGTWWLIHYHLVTNPREATTWYWFYNVFSRREFDEDTFIHWLQNYTVVEGTPIAESSLKKDFQCFVNTYLYEKRMEKGGSPEDNLNCPLRELKLLKRTGPKSFRVNFINRDGLHPLIVYYVISHQNEREGNSGKTTVSKLLEADCNIGRVFGLTYEDVVFYLEKLQREELLTVSLTAGLDSVHLRGPNVISVLRDYYESRKGNDGLWKIG